MNQPVHFMRVAHQTLAGLSRAILCALFATAITAAAQTAYWTGAAGNNLWHDPANWSLDITGLPDLPGPGTNVVISPGASVLYETTGPGDLVGPLTLGGQLTVATPGLWVDGLAATGLTLDAGGLLQIQAGGVLVVTNAGTLTFNTDSAVSLEGGALILTNHLPDTAVLNAGLNGNNNGVGITNRGGRFEADLPVRLHGRFSRFIHENGTLLLRAGGGIHEGSNDQERPWLIAGGEVFLGDFSISRTTPGGGLVISNGSVTATSLRIGVHNSRAYASVYGGTLTNTGPFTIGDRTNGATSGDRRIRLRVFGGTVVSTHPDGIIIANQSNASPAGDNVIGAGLEISGGQVFAEKLTLVRDETLENAHATLALSNNGTLWLGTGGLQAHVGVANTSYRVWLAGGTLGAQADHELRADLTLVGENATIHAADPAGQPRTVTVWGTVGGSGSLLKTGPGLLTLNGPATHTGRTLVQAGTLGIGHPDALANTSALELGAGAALDVSALGTFTWAGTRTLSGLGTVVGALTVQSAGVLAPGLSDQPGPLHIQGGLILGEGAVCQFDLPADPATPGADRIEIEGDLTLAGTVTFLLAGGGPSGRVHPLIRYTGSLVGDAAQIQLSGVMGALSNNTTTAKGLYLVITQAVRPPTELAWIGNDADNAWDTLGHTNWLNLETQQPDRFVSGDVVWFDDRGLSTGPVLLAEPVYPASVRVSAARDYHLVGPGGIAGGADLVKTGTGRLILETTNTYTGPTRLEGGTVETPLLAPGGLPSGLGAATADPEQLQFSGGTLRYTGPSLTLDRGATLEAAGGTLEVAAPETTLTLAGLWTGSGGLAKAGPGTLVLAGPNAYQGTTLVTEGALRVMVPGAAGTNRIELAGGTLWLTLPSDNDLPNPIHVAAPSRLQSGNLNNRINGAVSGEPTLEVRIPAGTVLTFNGDLTNFTGTFALGDSAGTFRFNSGGGNSTLGCPNATIDLGSATATLQARNAGTMFIGALRGGPTTQVLGQGSGSGTLTWVIGSSEREPDSTFEGTIADATVSRVAALTKVGTGTLRLTGSSTYSGPTTVESGTLQVDGSLGPTAVTVLGGTLAGAGLLNGTVDIQAGGTLAPGPGIATLTIANVLGLWPGSVTEMEVDPATGTSDQIAGLWAVTYGGTLRIIKVAGSFAPGQRFKLFDAPGAYYGSFDLIEPSQPGPGLAWDTSQLTVDGTLGVISTGTQPILLWSRVPGGLQLTWTGDYRLQSQTNALHIGLATNWVDVPGAFGSGTFIPLDPNAPTVFFRLVRP
ncbi:MAG: hypothetical protein KatS3mg132_906 [Limisphaera sp.]|nr:MAG: hypothetical protein KatS3mg132_906 [Limisphaera sp.]